MNQNKLNKLQAIFVCEFEGHIMESGEYVKKNWNKYEPKKMLLTNTIHGVIAYLRNDGDGFDDMEPIINTLKSYKNFIVDDLLFFLDIDTLNLESIEPVADFSLIFTDIFEKWHNKNFTK